MILLSARSCEGRTSSRANPNRRYISTVQSPIPLILFRAVRIISSSSPFSSDNRNCLLSIAFARSTRYSYLRFESPHLRTLSEDNERNDFAVMRLDKKRFRKRCIMESAAFFDSCCPMMASTKNSKSACLGVSVHGPTVSIILDNTLSFL